MKSAMRFWGSAVLLFFLSTVNRALSDEGAPPTLRVFTTTMTQIILQWEDPNPNTVSYKIQRDTDDSFDNPTEYVISPNSAGFKYKIFSDTNRQPGSKNQFSGEGGIQSLARYTTYYYRIKANLSSGGCVESEPITAMVSDPPEVPTPGDLWADVVLGQHDFVSNSEGGTNEHGTLATGGVLIDRSRTPNRMYILDANHNRILGFDHIPTPESTPVVVIGQPDFFSSGGNRNSTGRIHPYTSSPDASSLCLIKDDQISMNETWNNSIMALDEEGALYVPDAWNHRVLKYNDPFAEDGVADEVWGQDGFMSTRIIPQRGPRRHPGGGPVALVTPAVRA